MYCSAANAFAELAFLAYEAKAGVMIRHPLYALIRDISPQVPIYITHNADDAQFSSSTGFG